MTEIKREILEQVIAGTVEPLLVVSVDQPDWPVAMTNQAFGSVGPEDVLGQPFADVIEGLAGRELALEVSESVRSQQQTSFPVEANGREFLLVLKPLQLQGNYICSFGQKDSPVFSRLAVCDQLYSQLKCYCNV